jgi:ABC-2 type transport system permease protein
MTSPVSSSKPTKIARYSPWAHSFRQAVREIWVLMALSLLAYLLLFGGTFLKMIFDARQEHVAASEIGSYYLFSPLLSFFLPVVFLIAAMIGGAVAFRFLFQKSAANAWFSLGLTRGGLFLSRFLAGLLGVLAPVAAAMAANLVLNLAFFPNTELVLIRWAQMTAGLLAQAAALYAIAAAVCALAGTMAEALSYTFIAACLPSALLVGLNALMLAFLFGCGVGAPRDMWSGFSPQIAKDLSSFNPLLFMYRYIGRYAAENTYSAAQAQISALPIIGWLIAGAAIALLAYWIFKARRAETAGIMGGNRWLGFSAVFVVAFFAFAIPFMFSPRMSKGLPTAVWLLISVLAASAVFFILVFPLKLMGRPAWKSLLVLPAELAAMLAVVGVLASGGFGYSSYVPDPDDVASASVSYSAIPAYIKKSGWGGSSGITRSMSFQSMIGLEDPQDIAAAAGLHRAFADAGRLAFRSGETDPAAKTYNIMFNVEYTLKNGRKVSRLYPVMDRSLMLKLTEIDGLQGARETFRSHIVGSDTKSGQSDFFLATDIYLSSRFLDRNEELQLDDAQRVELIACVADDVAAQSVEDRYFPAKPEVCVLDFASMHESMSYGLPDWSERVVVTESFVKTVEFLSRNGMLDAVSAPADVDYLEVQNLYENSILQMTEDDYSFPVFINGKGSVKSLNDSKDLLKITDAAQVAAILQGSRVQYLPADGGYIVYIHYKGQDFITSAFLPMKDAPDYVKQNAK